MSRKLRVLVLFDLTHPVPADYDFTEDLQTEGLVTERDVVQALRELGHQPRLFGLYDDLGRLVSTLQQDPPDLVFNLSEAFRTDRRHEPHIAGLLELMKVPYTGTDPAALSLCKQKVLAKKILTYHHIKTPHFVLSPSRRPLKQIRNLRYPVFIKPSGTESSVGIAQAALAEDEKSALERVRFIHESVGSDALVEEYVDGRELYGGVLGNDRVVVLPLVELLVGDEPLGAEETPAGAPRFFTYKAKWDEAYRKKWKIGSGPARDLDPVVERRIRQSVRRAAKVLQVRGYGRVDLRLTDQGEVYIIEVNPNPGLAREDEFALAALRAGVAYPALIDRIVKLAEKAHSR
ncbi:MAG: ATP-grasp domain-containing protein [Myxococcota bacterium]|nr:ATP-grasp domain-containing protein [Myxococcota bacterium]